MKSRDDRRLARCLRRLEELYAWRDAREEEVRGWRFTGPDGVARGIEPGQDWPIVDLPVRLESEAAVPEGWAGQLVELELWLGGEGFVRLSNGVEGGLDPFHRSFGVTSAAEGGEVIGIRAEVVPKGLFGSHIREPRLEHARLVVPEEGVRSLERDLRAVVAACAELGDHEVVPLLLDVLERAFAGLAAAWPSGSETALTRFRRYYENPLGRGFWSLPPAVATEAIDVDRMGRELWSLPEAPRPLEPLPEAARAAVRKVRAEVAAGLREIKKEYPPVGRLALTGHAHLDLAWLWPLDETRRKAKRTFSNVLRLMDEHEDFAFNQSSAQLYLWVEEEHPELFRRVRDRVREGRWEPVGGSWTEPDCQITGGEAFVRQLFYGQRYFIERFGWRSTVAWLPDAFGFSPGIPQLLRGAGLTGFFTCKLNWNEANAFPYDLFCWEGVDGSRVTAHMTKNPGPDYNGIVRPLDLLGTWRNFKGKRSQPESLFPFGWGDGGGGPSERMLEDYERLKSFPALPRLRMARVEDFFAALPGEGLPLWVGELYLELHRGTLTSQGRVKKLNRAAEHRLLEAEAFAAISDLLLGSPYPHKGLEHAWKTLLLNQFHDILPGSSISEVYEDTHRQLEGVVGDAAALRDDALNRLAGRAKGAGGAEETITVFNASMEPQPLSVLLRGDLEPGQDALITDAGGTPVAVQETEGEGLLVHDAGRQVPGLGWTTLLLRRSPRSERPSTAPASPFGVRFGHLGEGAFLENELLRVEIGADGTLHSVYDKAAGREVLDGRANQLWAYVDKPREWDAWDVDEGYELEGEEITAVTSLRHLENGPLRATVDVTRRWRGSSIDQTYKLHSGSKRLDIETWIGWRERQVLLRALFPMNVRSHEAVFETMYGVVRRPTHSNTSWDAARFEVAAHRFCDLSEPGYGVALLNDGKYGHSARGNVLGISLLRSPMHPDPLADEGEHHFTYSLFPHERDWMGAGVTREAFDLNSPLLAVKGSPDREALPEEETGFGFGLVRVVRGVRLALGSLKKAEDGDGMILRLYEPHGARGACSLRFAREIERAERVNLLEEGREGTPPSTEGDTLHLTVRPFEVLTLRIGLRGAG